MKENNKKDWIKIRGWIGIIGFFIIISFMSFLPQNQVDSFLLSETSLFISLIVYFIILTSLLLFVAQYLIRVLKTGNW